MLLRWKCLAALAPAGGSGMGYGGIVLLLLGPGLVFGVVGAVLTSICRVRWRIGFPATFAALVVFALWWSASRVADSTAGDIAQGTLMLSIFALFSLVPAYLLTAAAAKGLAWLLRKP